MRLFRLRVVRVKEKKKPFTNKNLSLKTRKKKILCRKLGVICCRVGKQLGPGEDCFVLAGLKAEGEMQKCHLQTIGYCYQLSLGREAKNLKEHSIRRYAFVTDVTEGRINGREKKVGKTEKDVHRRRLKRSGYSRAKILTLKKGRQLSLQRNRKRERFFEEETFPDLRRRHLSRNTMKIICVF